MWSHSGSPDRVEFPASEHLKRTHLIPANATQAESRSDRAHVRKGSYRTCALVYLFRVGHYFVKFCPTVIVDHCINPNSVGKNKPLRACRGHSLSDLAIFVTEYIIEDGHWACHENDRSPANPAANHGKKKKKKNETELVSGDRVHPAAISHSYIYGLEAYACTYMYTMVQQGDVHSRDGCNTYRQAHMVSSSPPRNTPGLGLCPPRRRIGQATSSPLKRERHGQTSYGDVGVASSPPTASTCSPKHDDGSLL
jgi:hypothetical protein